MDLADLLAWLLIVVLAVGFFFVLPLSGWFGSLHYPGFRLVLAGIPIVAKLIHSLWANGTSKSK